jgi:hypothetical protein
VLSVFGSEAEARLAGTRLEAEGIPFTITKDDAGGMRPHLQLSLGVRLFVPAALVKRARRLLDAGD